MAARLQHSTLLVLAPLGALALSFWIMYTAGASSSVFAIQAAAIIGSAIAGLAISRTSRLSGAGTELWWLLLLLAALAAPLLLSSDGPGRWLSIAGMRVYVAAVVLPSLFILLGRSATSAPVTGALVVATAGVLAMQPDAAQVTAFAAGVLTLLFRLPGAAPLRLVTAGVLAPLVILAWAQPDPLAPVAYVEGVFSVALDASPWVFAAALCAVVAPVVVLLRLGSAGERGTGAVAMYYATILLLAPLQITPVPLLGFGAGPILGYCLAAGFLSQRTS